MFHNFIEKVKHSFRMMVISESVKRHLIKEGYVIEDLLSYGSSKYEYSPPNVPPEYYWITKYTDDYELKTNKGIIGIEHIWYDTPSYKESIKIITK